MASSHKQTNGLENDNAAGMLANTSMGPETGLFSTLQRTQMLSKKKKCCETIGTWTSARRTGISETCFSYTT